MWVGLLYFITGWRWLWLATALGTSRTVTTATTSVVNCRSSSSCCRSRCGCSGRSGCLCFWRSGNKRYKRGSCRSRADEEGGSCNCLKSGRSNGAVGGERLLMMLRSMRRCWCWWWCTGNRIRSPGVGGGRIRKGWRLWWWWWWWWSAHVNWSPVLMWKRLRRRFGQNCRLSSTGSLLAVLVAIPWTSGRSCRQCSTVRSFGVH